MAGVSLMALVSAPQAAPPLDFELASEQDFVRLSELPPQATLINFWRSDCPPCVAELPLLAQLAQQRRVIAVALQKNSDTHSAPAAVRAALQAPLIALHGPPDARAILARFGNRSGALPYTAILTPQRQLCAQHYGPVDQAWLEKAWQRCGAKSVDDLGA